MNPRAAGLAGYLLPSPLKWLAGRGGNELVGHHHRQAAALSFLLLAIVLSYVPAFLLLTLALVFWEESFERFQLEAVANGSYLGLLAAWVVLWLGGLVLAGLGSTRRLPFLAALGRRAWVPRTAAVGWAVIYVLAATVSGLAVHSTGVAGTGGGKPAQVYLLYDPLSSPRWLMTLAGYRMNRAAIARWGEGAAVVAPITPETLREGLSLGRLVFLATHGGSQGRMRVGAQELGPREVSRQAPPGKRLRLVYLTACHGGAAAREWRQAFAPAGVVAFERNSAVVEHGYWLWFRAPGVVAGLD